MQWKLHWNWLSATEPEAPVKGKRKKKNVFILQEKIQPIKHIWTDTQYLYHDNKDNLKAT